MLCYQEAKLVRLSFRVQGLSKELLKESPKDWLRDTWVEDAEGGIRCCAVCVVDPDFCCDMTIRGIAS